MVIFNSFLYDYQRVNPPNFWWNPPVFLGAPAGRALQLGIFPVRADQRELTLLMAVTTVNKEYNLYQYEIIQYNLIKYNITQ
jgi:hypothetical protein